ncbi:MAG: TIGR03619 family F420-dependent LLM class oxidoreductase, partial [Dehalococcoidia bacterium]
RRGSATLNWRSKMRFGTGFALTAMDDTVAVRDFAQALDGAGFDFVTTAGHLLCVEPGRFPDRPAATYVGPFYDPFVLFSYLAAVTERIAFRTSILILPLFPTALVAKQAAELSLFSSGRFQLGVGISWNEPEYQTLNQDIHTRGRRLAEQITVLRKLWTEPLVTFQGRWHTLDGVGLNRLPKAPIPLWMGTGADAGERVLRRVARLADGWTPLGDPTEAMPRLRQYLTEAGRDASTFRVAARVLAGPDGPAAWVAEAKRLKGVGVTDIAIGAPPDMPPSQAMARLIEARRVLADDIGG